MLIEIATGLAQADLVTKIGFVTKLIRLNKKINSNKTKHVLVKNELKKLRTFDSSYFKGQIILKKMVLKIT